MYSRSIITFVDDTAATLRLFSNLGVLAGTKEFQALAQPTDADHALIGTIALVASSVVIVRQRLTKHGHRE